MAEEDKRPQGREKRVTNNGKGIRRRGEGLNTGPVGKTDAHPNVQQAGGQSGPSRTRRSGGSPLLIIVILLLLLGGGGGGALSGLLGGGQSAEPQTVTQTAAPTPAPTPKPTPKPDASAGTTIPGAYTNLIQGSSSDWTAQEANVESLDSSVAGGSRTKYTQLKGGGKDRVTVLVYLCGTDLESKSAMATRDLIEMSKAKLSDKVRVIVYTGGCTQWKNQVVSAQANQIYEVRGGGLERLESNMGSDSMVKPETLAEFIRWGAKNCPADRYELIFWDHGGGSVSGYGYDQKYPRSGSMSLAGINQALKAGGVKFDFIGFDACLMATMETALMLDPYADYMIASEETEPGIGWYYTNWLSELSQNTSRPTVEIGKRIVDDFVTTCASQCPGQSATLSVIDLAELAYTAPAPMKAFSESLTGLISANNYAAVSNARNGAREFARSSAIDQVDLVHFARNVGNAEAKALNEALLGAVKYNRCSSNMSNAYGLSIYFPYRKAGNVDKAVSTYAAIGMDESYSDCIRAFASMEVSGQAATGGSYSALPSLLGTLYGSGSGGGYSAGTASSGGYSSADMIGSLLGAFLGGDFGSVGLDSADFLSGRALNEQETAAYIEDHFFDASALTWSENAQGQKVIRLAPEQWALVEGLDMNLFYDDGEGFIDMGLDTALSFDGEGNLVAETDRTWLALDGWPVAYYHEYTQGSGDDRVISGYIPALLNGERVELLVSFDAAFPYGHITGVRSVYSGETDTVAKTQLSGGETELDALLGGQSGEAETRSTLRDGDELVFIADAYNYDGTYDNTYPISDPIRYSSDMEFSNVDVGEGAVRICYRFTDLYQQHYWTDTLIG